LSFESRTSHWNLELGTRNGHFMRSQFLSVLLASASALLPSASSAQSTTNAPTTPAPCTRPEHRQFDFWVGEWDVTGRNGNPAGTNRIRVVHGGCALQEDWSGASGFTGTSINAFDASTGRWHQTWIGSDGVLLQLDGGPKDGSMELTGTTAGANGASTMHRIRWTPLTEHPGQVRQLWESSTDSGRTWSIAFDGTYKRKR
jgi:Protein of unknown function (DUF1579)